MADEVTSTAPRSTPNTEDLTMPPSEEPATEPPADEEATDPGAEDAGPPAASVPVPRPVTPVTPVAPSKPVVPAAPVAPASPPSSSGSPAPEESTPQAQAPQAASRSSVRAARVPLAAPASPVVPQTDDQSDQGPSDALPVGDLPGWHQILAEDFDTSFAQGGFSSSVYADRFNTYDGMKDTSGHGTYDSDVLSAKDGVLDWYLHSTAQGPRVAALVPEVEQGNWGQLYGRYSMRFRSDPVPGYKAVSILWPDSDVWREGEVDFPELSDLGTDPYMYANRYAAGRGDLNGDTAGVRTKVSASDGNWHVATIDWQPGSLTYYLDGERLGTTTDRVPATEFHWVLQLETAVNSPSPDPSAAGHFQVDWVAMYSRAE
ncbi:glycoside hydrolase family 16 protein [Microbacterium sp. LB12]|uniref:glycoside hydrolase family 16 protein n=2 Tax=unclassified Microbacterium TaxID=2609290 RepID=UPI0030174FA6